MFARMFNKRCAGYKALGYEIVMPLSTARGLPSNVSVLREKKLDETYAESVERLLRDGVTFEEIDLFAMAAAASAFTGEIGLKWKLKLPTIGKQQKMIK